MPECQRRSHNHRPYLSVIGHDEYKKVPRTYRSPVDVPYTKQQITAIFKNFDQNGDGKLSWDEVKEAFIKLGSNWASYRARRGTSRADANDDGFICLETELDELVNYTMEHQYKV